MIKVNDYIKMVRDGSIKSAEFTHDLLPASNGHLSFNLTHLKTGSTASDKNGMYMAVVYMYCRHIGVLIMDCRDYIPVTLIVETKD